MDKIAFCIYKLILYDGKASSNDVKKSGTTRLSMCDVTPSNALVRSMAISRATVIPSDRYTDATILIKAATLPSTDFFDVGSHHVEPKLVPTIEAALSAIPRNKIPNIPVINALSISFEFT